MLEGMSLSLVCQSFSICPQRVVGGSHLTTTHDALDLTTQELPGLRPSLYRDPRHGQVQTFQLEPHCICPSPSLPYPDIFKLVQLGSHCMPPPPPTRFNLFIIKNARTIGKRAVGILLECFLVNVNDILRGCSDYEAPSVSHATDPEYQLFTPHDVVFYE